MFLVSSGTSVIGIKYLYVDRAKNFFFSKMLRFQRQGYQMKALLKVDEEYQISDIYRLDFTIFSSKIKKKKKKKLAFWPYYKVEIAQNSNFEPGFSQFSQCFLAFLMKIHMFHYSKVEIWILSLDFLYPSSIFLPGFLQKSCHLFATITKIA